MKFLCIPQIYLACEPNNKNLSFVKKSFIWIEKQAFNYSNLYRTLNGVANKQTIKLRNKNIALFATGFITGQALSTIYTKRNIR